MTVERPDDDTWRYESDTVVRLKVTGGELHHTDRNTLSRVG